ncbi:LuxR C-terminal-related transcriptional regulator [Nocardioides sp.]|uniref:LuxR C-terminal-related transcriptional regulator n=1 Tax=Nocardioides sp. TaxID=35761 RepID=UPI002ECFEF39
MESKARVDPVEDGRHTDVSPMMAGWAGIPERPRQFLARGRLLEQLDADPRCSLVLVSAPAGTGKTTLVADWITKRGANRAEWITFDGEEAFWPGFAGCLERLGVPVSARSLPTGSSPLDASVRRAMASAVATHAEPMTVVVDGYEVDSAAVATDLDFLLRHTGHRLRLVLLTRADPVLPLYRYRLDETMTEVRMADLAFTDDEAAALLGKMRVVLPAESVRTLNSRTRGWVTGLRLAGRMLLEREDPTTAVDEVVGDRGTIAEYLMGEVLAAHPPEVRELLMATSIPDTITPGLAEALAGRSAARTLAFLVRVNVFIEQVPGHAEHYRYHPFFRELLRAELAYSAPGTMATLQRRAAEWFAEQGLITPSVRHFASLGAWEEAAEQVVDSAAVGQLVLDGGSSPLMQTLQALPPDLEHPAAAVVRATLAFSAGDDQGFRHEIDLVRGLPADGAQHAKAINLAVAVLVALRARFSEDPDEAEILATAAADALADAASLASVRSHPELAALVFASKGMAAVRHGELEVAEEVFRAGCGAAVEAGADPLLVECLGFLALLSCFDGDVTRGEGLANRAIKVAGDAGIPMADRSAGAHVALAWVAMDRFDLRAVSEHVRAAEHSDFIPGDPVQRTLLTLVKSRLQVAQGDRNAAAARIAETIAGMTDPEHWLSTWLRLEAAHLAVAGGDPQAAVAELRDVRESVAVAEVALLVAEARLRLGDDAAAMEALKVALDKTSPITVRVRAWLVECGRQLREGSSTRARDALEQALQLASATRLRRPFHETAAPVRHLLVQDPRLLADHAWLFEVSARGMPRSARRTPVDAGPRSAPVETLTVKELEVLVHLAEMLTTEEIAAAMYISVNTVRTHVRNILRKLGVSRRNAAVRVAREFDLIPA